MLRRSNAKQHQLASDLENLIDAVNIAFILVDRELRVRRYSRAAERLLRLIPADVGRRIGEIRWTIRVADLDQLAMAVLTKSQPQSKAVRDSNGRSAPASWPIPASYSGRVNATAKQVPDGALVQVFTRSRPWSARTSSLTTHNPNPVPLGPLVVKNGRKIRARMVLAMPAL